MKQYSSPNAKLLIPQTADILTLLVGDGNSVHSEKFGIPAINS